MKETNRVPRTIPAFRDYINDTDDYLLATDPLFGFNHLRLGITADNATDWHTKRVYFRDTLYPTYSNGNTRTPTVVHQLQNFMKNFPKFANPLLNIMAASPNAIEADETAMNFKIGRESPSRPTDPIAEECITAIIPKTGAKVKTSSRTSHDSKRASVAKGATGVQYAYKIGGSAPVNPEDGTVKEFLSGSSYLLSLGVENVGKKLYFYSRWFNPSYPQFAGPWSDMQTGGVA